MARPVSLNIQNERTHALDRELATLRGVSQTEAVTEAVEQRLAALRRTADDRPRRAENILRLAAAFRAHTDIRGAV